MAPTRKSRSVNKRYSSINEVSPAKDGENAKKSNPRKRKLSDMLGPQWTKEELTRFYDAYRKHGKDWKKVAGSVRNRSVEMVEALYTMNRAYLSLPEGTASVVGLIAMMTDYYCNLAGSDSEQESNDGAGTSRKPQKRPRGKIHPPTSKPSEGNTLSPSENFASTYGCLSLLKKKRSGGSRPRAVGKRTPRFPVSFSFENANGEKYVSPARQALKMKANANDDEVAHEILALAEASHRGGSPQVSQTPNRKTESVMSSPVRKAERKCSELETARLRPVGSDMDEEDLEGSTEADTGELSRYRKDLAESESAGKLFQRSRRSSGKKLEADDSIENQLDDIKEACSGTEESQRFGMGSGKFDVEVTDTQISRAFLQGPRKRSKKVLFTKDEESAFDALKTLADLSLKMPGVGDEDESMLPVKDEFDDHVDESGSQEAMPASHIRGRRKSLSIKSRGNQAACRFEAAPAKTSKIGKSILDDIAERDSKVESNQSFVKAVRKKPKALPSKIRKSEPHVDLNRSESLEAEASGKKSMSKTKRSSQSASPTLAKNHERSSSTDQRREGSDSAQSTVQVSAVNQVNLSTKARSRRKMNLKKPQMLGDPKFPEKILGDQTNDPSPLHDWALSLQMLSYCLSNYRARRWCIFEWFYSAIDYPWFAKREFVEYLYHVGLGHVPRLTRVEWGVIRSSLGKPRRFSEQFLKEEKEKLNQYRDSVRAHYTELREGIREGLPTDLARPLSVGQRVIAIHPKTREVHDGSVLTVDHSRCRIQFDRPELGVEFVMDIDCMPCNPLQNMPTSLARHAISVDKFFENLNELKANGRAKDYMKCLPSDALENAGSLSHLSPSTYGMSVLKQIKAADELTAADTNATRIGPVEAATYKPSYSSQPSTQTQIQAKEADVQALAQLTRALDKKEAVVLELRRMNDDVVENQKDGNPSLKDSEPFKKQYAAILVQLHEANQQVSSALCCLRQRNTYQGHVPVMWPNTNFIDSCGLLGSFDLFATQTQEPGSHVNEIIVSSKTKARMMVDAAMQAMSTLKVNDNAGLKIEDVLDYVNDRLPLDDSGMVPATDIKVENLSEKKESEIPSELITQCVATLLMIQKCTERQFPPADVAQILDSAVTGLQPSSSQNIPVYAEIQKCMGIIRNQILALIPT